MAKAIASVTPVAVNTKDVEIDEMEKELVTATTPKAPKAPKEPKINENQVGAADIAKTLGITSRELRMFLRKHFRDMSKEKGQTYVWAKESPEVQAIIDAYKAAKSAPKVVKEPKVKAEATTEATPQVAQVASTPVIAFDLDDLDLEEDDEI